VSTLRRTLILHSSKYSKIIQEHIKHMNSLSLVWSPLTCVQSILYYGHISDLCPLLQDCSWGTKQGLGIVTCNIEDLVVIDLYVCFLKSFLQHFVSEWLTAHIFGACAPLMQVSCVPECPWEGLGNMRHLCEWGTSSEGGAVICHVECITQSVAFFQFGENAEWIVDGFALGKMCARCMDIDHFCTKSSWV